MRNPGGGYTIIEVLIFLAVSGLLLFSAVRAVGGQQGHTEFTTSMNDVNTKFQQWFDQVSNGFSGTTSNANVGDYNCDVTAAGYPVLSAGTNLAGANPKCIFLGKVIQINTDPNFNNKIYVYPVLGRRTYVAPSGDTVLSDSLANAKPIAAYFPGVADLTEDYLIQNGARILSVKNGCCSVPDSRMIGLFSSFNTESSAVRNGNQSLSTVSYPLNSNYPPKATAVLDCIKLTGSCAAAPNPPWPLQTMQICFGSTRNDDTAVLSINSSQGHGVSTKLEVKPCT